MINRCCETCSKAPAFIALYHNQMPCSVISKLLDSNKHGANGAVDQLVWINQFTKENGCNLWAECDIQMLLFYRGVFDEKLKKVYKGW